MNRRPVAEYSRGKVSTQAEMCRQTRKACFRQRCCPVPSIAAMGKMGNAGPCSYKNR